MQDTLEHRKHSLTITLALAAALALSAMPIASAQDGGDASSGDGKTDAAPDRADFTVELRDATTAVVTVEQHWEGQNAKSFRQSLDVFFGAGDGKLTEDEAARIADATAQDMRNKTLPFVSFDGQSGIVSDVTVDLSGAVGGASSTTALVMRHVIDVELTPAEGDAHTLTINPIWSGDGEVRVPAGWTVDGESTATASLTAGSAKTFEIEAGGAGPTDEGAGTPTAGGTPQDSEEPQEATETAEPGKRPSSIPGAGAVLATLALVGAAFVWSRRRRT